MGSTSLIDELELRVKSLLAAGSLGPANAGMETLWQQLRSWDREVSMVGLAVDVEREGYRELLETVSQGYLRTDMDGIIREANDAAAVLLGAGSEPLCGRPLASFLAEEQRQDLYRRIERLLRGDGDSIQQWQSRIQPPEQPAFAVTLITFPRRDPEGEVTGLCWLLYDSTDRTERMRERELLAMANIASALRTAPNLAEMLPIIVEQGLQLLQAQGVCLALRDAKSGEIAIEGARGAWSHWPELDLPPGADLIAGVVSTGRPCYGAGARGDGRLACVELPNDLPALVCFPLIAQGQTIGAILAGRQYGFAEGDLRVLSVLTEIAANAIYRARLHEQTRQLNEQMVSRERFIARILDSIPTSLLVVDRALRIVSANRNFEEKSHRDARTIVGRSMAEVLPQVLRDYTRLDPKLREVFRTGRSIDGGKLAYRAPNVPTRIYYYRCIPLKGDDENVENVMLLMDDITERERLGQDARRAEQHLASVVECADDLVISTDARGAIVTCNRATELTLHRNAEEIKGHSLTAFGAPGQPFEMDQVLQRVRRGEMVRNVEMNLLTPEKQEVPVAWSLSPMLDDAGEMSGIVMVGRDLTETRQLEAQLILSAKMVSLGVMAGGIAHELRNPLGIISASAQLLLEYPDDCALAAQCAEKIWGATHRASLIIENLLKFARPQPELTSELDLNAVLEEILGVLANQLSLWNTHLSTQLQADLPRVCGNAPLLQQVFANVIINACNAMDQGGLLEISSRASGEDEVEMRFRDHGRGIPPENLDRVVDPFFTTMPVGQGIGLGLSISYSIIKQHQGTMRIESQVGQGTTVTICLPIAPTAAARAQVRERAGL